MKVRLRDGRGKSCSVAGLIRWPLQAAAETAEAAGARNPARTLGSLFSIQMVSTPTRCPAFHATLAYSAWKLMTMAQLR
jgi:hypothetical protein